MPCSTGRCTAGQHLGARLQRWQLSPLAQKWGQVGNGARSTAGLDDGQQGLQGAAPLACLTVNVCPGANEMAGTGLHTLQTSDSIQTTGDRRAADLTCGPSGLWT